MRSKILFPWSVVILCTTGAIFSTIVIFFLVPSAAPAGGQVPQNLESAALPTEAMPQVSLPIRITIPKIKVDAAIEYVGLTPDGAMAVPAGPTDTAWFDLGPRPGEIGSAVIAGHEGWKDGIHAVFDSLHELAKGDEIYVENASGTTLTFIVQTVKIYDQNADAAAVFSSSDGLAHLNLITCEGTWNAAEKSYSNRIVVFADEETD